MSRGFYKVNPLLFGKFWLLETELTRKQQELCCNRWIMQIGAGDTLQTVYLSCCYSEAGFHASPNTFRRRFNYAEL